MPDWRHAIERRLAPLQLVPTREAEIVEELAQHLDDRYEEMRADGVPDDAARRPALAELDDADLVRELTGIEQPAAEPLALGGAPQAPGLQRALARHPLRRAAARQGRGHLVRDRR